MEKEDALVSGSSKTKPESNSIGRELDICYFYTYDGSYLQVSHEQREVRGGEKSYLGK